ncbi:MAG: hypothetical protein ABJ360_16540 [Roseobacter sp.]
MTLQLAKQRRLEALENVVKDRTLVEPAAHSSQVKVPSEDTVAGYLFEALGRGCSIKQLETETGWSKSNVLVNLYTVAKKSGFGLHRKNGKIYLILPEGTTHVYPQTKFVAWESTARSQPDTTMIAGAEAV